MTALRASIVLWGSDPDLTVGLLHLGASRLTLLGGMTQIVEAGLRLLVAPHFD
jgi:hypothetical protein